MKYNAEVKQIRCNKKKRKEGRSYLGKSVGECRRGKCNLLLRFKGKVQSPLH